MKRIVPVIILMLTLLQACQNAVSDEDLRDSMEVIRAADLMLKLDTAAGGLKVKGKKGKG